MLEYSVYSIMTGMLISFIAGTSLTWTSPEIGYLNATDAGVFDGSLTDDESSWIGGVLSIGAALGPFVFGYLADRIGRKYTLLSLTIPFGLSSLASAFANKVSEFLIARLITGLGVGGTFSVLPMYIGEMSLNDHRGILGAAMNIFICTGLIFTYVVGTFVSNILAFNLLLAALTGAFFILFLLIGAETPHYYVQKNKHDLAKQALLKIRDASEDEVEKELELIRSEIEKEERGSMLDIFRNKGSRKAFIIGSGLVFFQQMSGINAVLFFAQVIFEQAGTSLKPAYCSMIIGSVQFGTSFITPVVSNVLGRKILLIFSAIGMALSESILGIYGVLKDHDEDSVNNLNFLPILSLVLYIITYNVGFGPVPWVIMGELFPNSIKSSASALATAVCWITSFIITKWFSQLAHTLGQGTCFLGFATASLLAGVFVHFVVLETKGKTLSEIQVDLNK
ncbi:facilitated trehalose transporter Tret1-2 homolog [Euwallacea similis]|uniref:facilitated trehalose transporter Tret1-2 homolog n=1 Tax=Euwallacea similis TaxID=1736056 RepID=UPI00344D9794